MNLRCERDRADTRMTASGPDVKRTGLKKSRSAGSVAGGFRDGGGGTGRDILFGGQKSYLSLQNTCVG